MLADQINHYYEVTRQKQQGEQHVLEINLCRSDQSICGGQHAYDAGTVGVRSGSRSARGSVSFCECAHPGLHAGLCFEMLQLLLLHHHLPCVTSTRVIAALDTLPWCDIGQDTLERQLTGRPEAVSDRSPWSGLQLFRPRRPCYACHVFPSHLSQIHLELDIKKRLKKSKTAAKWSHA